MAKHEHGDHGHNRKRMTDQVARLNPATKAWTLFDLPTRGGEARYVSTLETTQAVRDTDRADQGTCSAGSEGHARDRRASQDGRYQGIRPAHLS